MVLFIAAVAGVVLIRPLPTLHGDGLEYAAVMFAWLNHGSPDIRETDVRSLPPLFEPEGYSGLHPYTVVTAQDGRVYGLHFWLYPLLCAPAALLLRAGGANPLTAFAVTNTLLFALIIAAACWSPRLTRTDRMLILLAAVGPILRFLHIAHPEAFTWACVLASLVALNHARYGIAAGAAACGAMQNPPVATLVLYCVVAAAVTRSWPSTLRSSAGAALALAPPLFWWSTLGHFNPVANAGLLDLSWGIAERAWGLIADLDQGLIAYVPGLIIIGLAGVASDWKRRSGLLAVCCGMLFGAATNVGANSAFPGLMRYLIWIIPIVAWLAADVVVRAPQPRLVLGLTLLLHAALVAPRPPDTEETGRLTNYALSYWPAWYRPAPGVFISRLADLHPALHDRLPIGFVRNDGIVTKLLVDAPAVARLDQMFAVDPAYLRQALAQSQGASRPFYLNPPEGSVRSRCAGTGIDAERFRRSVRVRVLDLPTASTTRQLQALIEVANAGDQPLCNLGTGAATAVNVAYVVRQGERVLQDGIRTRGPQFLTAGGREQLWLRLPLPAQPGQYALDVAPVLEQVTWGEVGATVNVEVQSAEPSYYATINVR